MTDYEDLARTSMRIVAELVIAGEDDPPGTRTKIIKERFAGLSDVDAFKVMGMVVSQMCDALLSMTARYGPEEVERMDLYMKGVLELDMFEGIPDPTERPDAK